MNKMMSSWGYLIMYYPSSRVWSLPSRRAHWLCTETSPAGCSGSGWWSRPDLSSQTQLSRTEPGQRNGYICVVNCEMGIVYLLETQAGWAHWGTQPRIRCSKSRGTLRLFCSLHPAFLSPSKRIIFLLYEYQKNIILARTSYHVHTVEHITASPDHRHFIQELHWVSILLVPISIFNFFKGHTLVSCGTP